MSSPLETYLNDISLTRSSGGAVKETSGYPALSVLLNEVGKTLKPKVRCVINLQNQGAGLPDGGLYSAEQFQKRGKTDPLEGQLPSRGCIEVKSPGEDALVVAKGEQVRRYLNRYRQVLITNYRDFILVGLDRNGNLEIRERFTLATSEAEFWTVAAQARTTADELNERFVEYLKRVMLHAAPLALPKDVAWFLASYARDAKARIEKSDLPALIRVRSALEEALGLKFEGPKGDHFFRSTLVQTLFYGVFSSWVLWSKNNPPTKREARFNWHEAAWSLHVPMIKALFDQIATPTQLRELDIVELLDWTTNVLNRVVREEFFDNFEEDNAVQYFYEPFLQAFDPELRKELGVWYTPIEIVKYMVARVDSVLREELDIPDGLADPRVYVLDLSCGTGAYLVEVLHKIHETLKAKGEDALIANDVKVAAMTRVFGFEILPAPFVVSHLQLGLLLQNLGAPLAEKEREPNERVGVYLTNALTGWELRDQPPLNWLELDQERRGSGLVKRDKPILVVLGNPPYNAFAGRSPKEEEGLVEDYKGIYFEDAPIKGSATRKKRVKAKRIRRYRLSDPPSRGGWGIKKFNLDELYVRFFRLAERRIAEKTKKGIVCFISNFSYLSDPSFVIARERFLSEFDKLWFDSMNGDSRETGKLTPEGKPDPSVFSTEYNREGIRIGTAIGLLVRKEQRDAKPTVRFRQFWGVTKRADLLASLSSENLNADYEVIAPIKNNRLSFRPSSVTADYQAWPRVIDLCLESPSNGLMEKRGGALIDINKAALERRIEMFYDETVEWETIAALGTGLTKKAAGFEPRKVRSKLQKVEGYQSSRVQRYALRPFDTRWSYYSEVSPLWNRSRPALWAQCWKGNSFLLTRFKAATDPEGAPFYFTSLLNDDHLLSPDAVAIPIRLRKAQKKKKNAAQSHFFADDHMVVALSKANLSTAARSYLKSLGIEPDADIENAALVWMHALAIGFAPQYLAENTDGIRADWPRIPLPATKDALVHSAELGGRMAALLDTEQGLKGITIGAIIDPLKSIGIGSHAKGESLNSEDLKVTAGWGFRQKASIMPGKGKLLERDYTPDERKAIERGAELLGLTDEEGLDQLGERTCDVYLNDVAYWKNIPSRVWEYTVGGYQVIKKWLSYREVELLDRPLTPEEAREVMNMARRIASIVLLEPSLDSNYQAVKDATYSWPV